jgi:hypothetical protein
VVFWISVGRSARCGAQGRLCEPCARRIRRLITGSDICSRNQLPCDCRTEAEIRPLLPTEWRFSFHRLLESGLSSTGVWWPRAHCCFVLVDKEAVKLTAEIDSYSVVVLSLTFYLTYLLILRPFYFSPYVDWPGPTRKDLLLGRLPEIFGGEMDVLQLEWMDRYGPIIRAPMPLGVRTFIYIARHLRSELSLPSFVQGDALFISDARALSHILVSNERNYVKPTMFKLPVKRLFGRGILLADGQFFLFSLVGRLSIDFVYFATPGDEHRRQKKIMAPAFQQSQANRLFPVFLEQANKVRTDSPSTGCEASSTETNSIAARCLELSSDIRRRLSCHQHDSWYSTPDFGHHWIGFVAIFVEHCSAFGLMTSRSVNSCFRI